MNLHVSLICTSQGIDTSEGNAAGKLPAHVIMAMAEFEHSLIRERARAGLAAAKDRRVTLGRPATLSVRAAEVQRLKGTGLGIRAIARQLGMPPASVCKALKLPVGADQTNN